MPTGKLITPRDAQVSRRDAARIVITGEIGMRASLRSRYWADGVPRLRDLRPS